MIALANYAKFTGRYDQFLQLKKRYSLKWSKGDSLQTFERFFNEELTLEAMLQQIMEMVDKPPTWTGNIFKFACLIGLRASEVIECVNLITGRDTYSRSYYNPERQALEHFRFPSIFIRQTKKAYISFVTQEMLDIVKLPERIRSSTTYNDVRYACWRAGIKCDMRFCRKIFASWLRQSGGIQPEVVNLLQGRVDQDVLTRHYLVPQEGLKNQVLKALEKLKEQID